MTSGPGNGVKSVLGASTVATATAASTGSKTWLIVTGAFTVLLGLILLGMRLFASRLAKKN